MKHEVQLRLPRFFSRKKKTDKEETPEVTTKVFIEDEMKEIPTQVIIGATLAIGLTAGYLIGYRNGSKSGGNTIIFKD